MSKNEDLGKAIITKNRALILELIFYFSTEKSSTERKKDKKLYLCNLMGCLKLTYQNFEPTLKVVYKKPSFEGNNVQRFLTVDPLASSFPHQSPYSAFNNNPIYFIDPDGRAAVPPSTDVTKNEDGSYTVVGAKNDGDNNIYVVGDDGKRTGETIGTTMKSYDFMSTNDKTGTFTFDKNLSGVTFSLDKLTVTGTVSPNEHTTATIYNADAQRLLDWGQGLFNQEVKRQGPVTFYGQLQVLKSMSANGEALDFKVSLGLPKYTAIRAGNTSDGKPIITTLRAMWNMTFGANMRATKPYTFGANWYYKQVMPEVGKYNQKYNGGNGYNSGFPYYGEHTYSGSYIYYGYFGKFHK